MEIHCKNCGSKIPASNIDLNGQIAKCDYCNSIFNCTDELLKVSKYIFLTFFTVLYGLFFFEYLTSPTPENYRITSPPSVQALVGVALTYIVLSGCINKTNIIVNPQSLIIKHGPIPAWGNKNLNAGLNLGRTLNCLPVWKIKNRYCTLSKK